MRTRYKLEHISCRGEIAHESRSQMVRTDLVEDAYGRLTYDFDPKKTYKSRTVFNVPHPRLIREARVGRSVLRLRCNQDFAIVPLGGCERSSGWLVVTPFHIYIYTYAYTYIYIYIGLSLHETFHCPFNSVWNGCTHGQKSQMVCFPTFFPVYLALPKESQFACVYWALPKENQYCNRNKDWLFGSEFEILPDVGRKWWFCQMYWTDGVGVLGGGGEHILYIYIYIHIIFIPIFFVYIPPILDKSFIASCFGA